MKICLVMIVKNESHVLGRALDSVADIVDYVYIQDNGSTEQEYEAMIDLIECRLPDKSYTVFKDKWKDFAHNRTLALRCAEGAYPDADWLFMLDADDYVESWGNFKVTDEIGLMVNVKSPGIVYPRTQLFKARVGWHYRGVVHEFPEWVSPYSLPVVSEAPITVISTREGDRNRNGRKYQDDAALLEKAIADPATYLDLIPRYQFYLAQSYEGCGNIEQAIKWCKIRADNKAGYQEERYVALLRLARMYVARKSDILLVLDVCRHAQEICPYRREAAYVAITALNDCQSFGRALNVWKDNPLLQTPTGLFIETSVYEWQYLEQAGIAAYYTGHYKLSVYLFAKALRGLPNKSLDMARLANNLSFPIDKL